MIKWIIIVLLLSLYFWSQTQAGEPFTEQIVTGRDGKQLVRITSHVNYTAYCKIYNDDNTHFVDWYLLAGSVSRWYYVPEGDWNWSCS